MKRSILFGVLAMFAVSALSVQNLNAQNVKVGKNAQAINEPKDKPADQATTKDESKSSTNAINEPKAKPQASDESNAKEPAMRTMQNPNGEKNVAIQKDGKKQDVSDKTTGKKTIKKNRPKKVSKNEKMENNTKSGVAKPGQDQGNESNKIQKSGKNDKIENNSQSSQAKPEQGQGNENDTKKNKVNPKLQKSEPKPQPNSVPRPKPQQPKEGTGTNNNTGSR